MHAVGELAKERVPRRDILGSDVGRRIKAARAQRGLTLAQVGGEDLSRSFLSLVESGRSRISLRALAIVADRLEMPIGHFLQDQDLHLAIELALDYAEIELEKRSPDACLAALDAQAEDFKTNARAQWVRGRAHMALLQPAEAVQDYRRALEIAESGPDSGLTAEILYSLGSSLYSVHNYEDALKHFRKGLGLDLESLANPGLEARLNMGVGHVLYIGNEPDAAISYYDRARELFGALYDLANIGSVFSAMSLACRRKGDLEAALHYSKESLAAFRLLRDWKQVARESNNMAMRYRDLGDLDAAIERAEEAVTRARQAHSDEMEAHAHGTLATVLLQQGNLERAELEATAAERLASGPQTLAVIDAWIVQAEIAIRRDDHERGDELYKRALDGLRDLGHSIRLADTALHYSRVLKDRGDLAGALEAATLAAEVKSPISAPRIARRSQSASKSA